VQLRPTIAVVMNHFECENSIPRFINAISKIIILIFILPLLGDAQYTQAIGNAEITIILIFHLIKV